MNLVRVIIAYVSELRHVIHVSLVGDAPKLLMCVSNVLNYFPGGAAPPRRAL